MTLHDAIVKLLKQGSPEMTIQEIAEQLNSNGWYIKKDGSPITAFQIHRRTKNYAHIFKRNGQIVSLINGTNSGELGDLHAKPISKKPNLQLRDIKNSFEPISNTQTSILILGTLPGDKSLSIQEYYGNVRNRFWKIISFLTKKTLPNNYSEKKSLLFNANVGLWDVAYNANRLGSLDSNIKDEEPNDLELFISTHKNLKTIAFNGKKSELLYDKYFERKKDLRYFSLPSSSPANTIINFENICMEWAQIFDR